MGTFAKINQRRVVVDIIKATEEYIETLQGTWIECSKDGWRKNYPGKGYTYDYMRDAFIAPKPYASWVLNEDTCRWEAPTPMPNMDEEWYWDEDSQSWLIAS